MYISEEETFDIERGYNYLEKSIAKGNAEALYLLGQLMISGYEGKNRSFVIDKDPRAGAEKLRSSVLKGNYSKALELGDILYYGKMGVLKNYSDALTMYEISLRNADPEIDDKVYLYRKIISMYKDGRGVQKDLREAKRFYEEMKPLVQ